MGCRPEDLEAANVDSIQAKSRTKARKTLGVGTDAFPKDLLEFDLIGEKLCRLFSPIVEISGQNERLVFRNLSLNPFADAMELMISPPIRQVEVHVEQMQGLPLIIDTSVENPSSLEAMIGDIDVFPAQNGQAGQNGVAMMALCVDRVFAIGEMRPDLIG